MAIKTIIPVSIIGTSALGYFASGRKISGAVAGGLAMLGIIVLSAKYEIAENYNKNSENEKTIDAEYEILEDE